MTRPTVKSLITEDLGYCCPWFFFTHFRQSQVVADRLGVTKRAVQYAKADVREGREVCQKCEGCLHQKVTLEGELRKKPLTPRP